MITVILTILLPILSAASAEFEGGGSSFGNGGHSVICSNQGQWSAPIALDLYEGRLENSYTYPTSIDFSAEEIALGFAKKMDKAIGYSDITGRHISKNSSISSKVRIVAKNLTFEDNEVEFTHDSRFQNLEANCKLVQTINFQKQIRVSKSLWQEHSIIDQAALLLHESIYWYLRSQGKETDSRRVRRLVAYLFSGGELTSVIDSQKWKIPNSQVCRSRTRSVFKDTEFYVFENQSGNTEIQFRRLGKYRMLSRTTLIGARSSNENTPAIHWERESGSIEGYINSISDKNTKIKLSWNSGRNEIRLEGMFEGEYPIDDLLVCHPLN
jgi:hypothetical protein